MKINNHKFTGVSFKDTPAQNTLRLSKRNYRGL